ncbi:unnamed protein product [Allacma fusca]|uniref:BHLH domain-containing protein n=1 Tax=Allacma fusca TaxID=39272 RepID=A0A8J2NQ04_9HEXA|nr:unnamed protein product [Allacma fusca]
MASFGNPSITMSPSSSTKSQPNSPMSPVTPSKNGEITQSSQTDLFGSRCKRKINFTQLGIPGHGKTHQPATVARRNARERNRVKQVNNGFAALKQHIPLGHRSKKMSKVETLKCAVEYIKNLQGLLDTDGSTSRSNHESAFQQLLPQKFELNSSGSHTSYNQLSPTSSDDPSSPSYASEGSYVTSTAISYDCENYEPVSPEDEELLDAISWWQQS